MKFIITLIIILIGLSLQAQTNVVHSQNPLIKQQTNICFGFVMQSSALMTNQEKNITFTNSTLGGVMIFSCEPSNDTVVSWLSYPLQTTRTGCGTNSVTWTNIPGETGYTIGFSCNKKLPAKPVVGTTTGLKP